MSEKVTLSGVPETMLQTVYARAKESRTRGAIQDKKAEELVEKLGYDFEEYKKYMDNSRELEKQIQAGKQLWKE